MRSSDAHGQPALYVTDPEGVDLPVVAALHDGYGPRRATFHGDKFLERAIERGVCTFGPLARGEAVLAGGHGLLAG